MVDAHAAMDLSIRESSNRRDPSTQAGAPDRARATSLTRAGIHRLATAVRALARGRRNSTEYHMEVASVFRDLYGERLEALRAGEGPSFSDLARDLRHAIKRTTLHRALWGYEVRESTPIYKVKPGGPATLPAGPATLPAGPAAIPTLERVLVRPAERERLTVTHYYAVHAFDTAERSELLSIALYHGWSGRRLQAEVAALTERERPAPVAVIFKLLHRTCELRPKEIDVTPLGRLPDSQAEVYGTMVSELEALVLRAKAALAERRAAPGGE
jgi:hypothetical protein